MAKFTFPIPGRSSKKQAAPVVPAEPLTKAQRILGATQLTAESDKAWNNVAIPTVNVSISHKAANQTKGFSRTRSHSQRPNEGIGNNSDVVPRHLRNDYASDYANVLREQTSSSTIRSWYDKAKQPLAITQQTSASAMAKGPPSKAYHLLDMDHVYAAPAPTLISPPPTKAKKKPSKLDLTRDTSDRWDPPVLEDNYLTRSPSVASPMSPTTPSENGKRQRQKIRKRPTVESLKKQPPQPQLPQSLGRVDTRSELEARQAHAARPFASASQPSPTKLDELPSLYKHYEQMSFAQIMDDQTQPIKETIRPEKPANRVQRSHHDMHDDLVPVADYRLHAPQQQQNRVPGPLNSHPTVGSHSSPKSYSGERIEPPYLSYQSQLQRPSTKAVQGSTSLKIEPRTPTDYAASVSSRHTRTSKASRRTDKSFPLPDLQESSVLMLSSDSEEDMDSCAESSYRSPSIMVSEPSRSIRQGKSTSVAKESNGNQSTSVDDTQSLQSRQSTITSLRKSSAPAGFLTVPRSSMAPSMSPVVSQEGHGPREHQTATLYPGQGLDEDSDRGSSNFENKDPLYAIQQESSMLSPLNAAEPTPPLSPLSMDQHMRDAESRESAHDHYMGLTRQEQILITALRQRRELMGKAQLNISTEEISDSEELLHRKGHLSKASEATITESMLKFDFPAPPKHQKPMPQKNQHGPSASASSNASPATTLVESTTFVLSPPPSSHHRASHNVTRGSSVREPPKPKHSFGARRSHVPTPLNHGSDFPAPNRTDYDAISAPRAKQHDGLTVPRSESVHRQRSIMERTDHKSMQEKLQVRAPAFQNWPIVEEESAIATWPIQRQYPDTSHHDSNEHLGVPRPDSPISPMVDAFPMVVSKRSTIDRSKARLSAFGPPEAARDGESGWWAKEY